MFKNYLKITWAVLKRRKFFTFVSLFGITFTLAILMVVVAIYDHSFGKYPPETRQDRTLYLLNVCMWGERDDGRIGPQTTSFVGPRLIDMIARDLPGVERVGVYKTVWKIQSFVEDRKIESWVKYTDTNYWKIMDFDFLEGRHFTNDEVDNIDRVCVINSSTSKKFFGRSSAIDQSIEVDGMRYRVIGVVEDIPFIRMHPFSDIWLPLKADPVYAAHDQLHGSHIAILLAESRSMFPIIREEFLSRLHDIDMTEFDPYDHIVTVPETLIELVARMFFGQQGMSEEKHVSKLYTVVFILVILFMILPSVNLVNLNVSRILERSSEIGIRKSFGASSSVLVGQFIVENVILTFIGGFFGIILAYIMLGIISHAGWIPYAHFSLNWRIFFYALLVTLFFGFMSGVIPAWRMSRMHPVEALRGGVA